MPVRERISRMKYISDDEEASPLMRLRRSFLIRFRPLLVKKTDSLSVLQGGERHYA